MPRSSKQRAAAAQVPLKPEARRAPSGRQAAAYVAEISAQLARMATHARLDLLAHFLTMARIEAEAQAQASDDGSRREA